MHFIDISDFKKNELKKIILSSDSISVIKNADCIMTDVWSSMGGKISLNRLKLFKNFQINEKLMTYAKKMQFLCIVFPLIEIKKLLTP